MLTSLSIISCGKEPSAIIGFASYLTVDRVDYPIYYTDDYFFDNPASSYNKYLATASACFALSGFSAAKTNDFDHCPENAKDFFKVNGFTNFKSNNLGVEMPTVHSFGVYMASKKVKDYTLIGITTRGAGYLAEWGSNFMLGESGEFATGFNEASEIYLDTLRSYISENNIKGKIKIWAAGYSRGGAGTNLAIGKIDDGLRNNVNILSEDVTYTKDDIYAYCFETPAGKVATLNSNKIVEKGEDYSNIHCIINLNDMVPFVGPKEYEFVRYGKEYYLPDILSDLNYEAHLKDVKYILANLPNSNIVGNYMIDSFKYGTTFDLTKKHNWTMNRFLESFIGSLAQGVGSRSDYSHDLEKPLSDLFALIYKTLTPKDSLIDLAISVGKNIFLQDTFETVLVDLQHNPKRTWDDFKPMLTKALNKTNIEGLNVEEMVNLLKSLIDAICNIAQDPIGLQSIPSLINFNNFSSLASAHYPELLLSHMTALDDQYGYNSGGELTQKYLKIALNKNIDFVLKYKNEVLASLEDGVFKTSLVAEESNESVEIYLPTVEGYVINSNERLSGSLLEKDSSKFYYEPVPETDAKLYIKGDITW